MGAGNATLTATATIMQFRLTIDLAGGTYTGSVTGTDEQNRAYVEHDYNTTYVLVNPTKTGYVFTGWNTPTAGSLAEDGYTYTFAATDATITATWRPITYQVKFDGNNATSGQMDNQSFTYNVSQALPLNNFARTGYTFKGWSTT